jgi:calcineurin-like phosphoesterase family protein
MAHEIFMIGDLHFGHKNIITFEPEARPFETIEEHDEELVRRWNSVVDQSDTVWVLGDFCFGADTVVIAGRLNGKKHLVLGNHDTRRPLAYTPYFDRLVGCWEFKRGVLLSHMPVHKSQSERYWLNVHGHLHSKRLDDDDGWYYNVSAEHLNLTPKPWEEIRKDALVKQYEAKHGVSK